MASSGTVGQTIIDTTSIIEHAFRRCGKLASTVSSELQLSAKENLYFLLSDLANRGLSLWCLQKHVVGVIANQIVYPMPVGTVDVNACAYRTKTDLTGSVISGAGYQGVDLGTATTVTTVTAMFAVPTAATLLIEWSADSITWLTQATLNNAMPVAAGVPICADVDNSSIARYWRVRDTSGTISGVASLTFSQTPLDLPMTPMSNDDYAALPDKTRTGSKALQYWYDKQINPQIWVWPASAASGDQIVVWTQSHIQDVGALTNTLNIPQRWFESVILTLACRCALELPAGELPEGRYELLKMEATEHLQQAENSESDGSPIRISPRISGYTR